MKPGSSKFSRPTTSKKPQNPIKKSIPTVENQNIYEVIQQLIMQQKQCQKKGKYIQAQQFKRQVKALKQQSDKFELIDIRKRHQKQREQIQEAHLQEMNCFNIEWDEKITELKNCVAEMENQLAIKHEQQTRAVEEELLAEKPAKFKESAQLLNLRRIQQQLAKQEDYLEAHKVQNKAQKLEKEQLEKWKRQQGSKCKSNVSLLRTKQQSELSALRQRIDLMFEEKMRQRSQDYQKIMLKYQNVMKELEFQQKQEITKFQKAVKLASNAKKTKYGILSTSKMSVS